MLREKINDPKFLRYLQWMFKSGVLVAGELRVGDEGVPQGSLCSPVLSNIFAHYVIDVWLEEVVKVHCPGKVAWFRYADDLVICCEYERDALRVRKALNCEDTFNTMVCPSISVRSKRSWRKRGGFSSSG